MAEVIKTLAGTINGSNTSFTTPTQFVSGTVRVAVNGVFYASDDAIYGYSTSGTNAIEMTTAPKTGSSLQAFYTEPEVVGSPHHPSDSYT